ncbi:THAP domain-containing protein 2-like isoform X2 [Corythoichthys intestinalis]|uniref:THAP domain-containing protein 2-like isoform X2 n=1 Tax=Corythoichthys intestinalis TaxID=161448 RepID=UPI0025A4FBE3|nr:THAP domain-containing protein 2-like isoform X2 [Corythoichthys intestinalis]
MPDFCAARGCHNERSAQTKTNGITFHKFPKNKDRRIQWERAVRRHGFVASDRSLLCSEHFKQEDFDKTGQTVRLRANVVPKIFCFSAPVESSLNKKKPVVKRTTATSRRAAENWPTEVEEKKSKTDSTIEEEKEPTDPQQNNPPPENNPSPDVAPNREAMLAELHAKQQAAIAEVQRSRRRKITDHQYALPFSPKDLKLKFELALKTVQKLRREKVNALMRERRAKKYMQAALEELKQKNEIIEDLQDKLECYSDIPVELLARQGVEYTKDQKDFAFKLYLHGPKAYNYLRERLKIHLPHPSSIQRWLSTAESKQGLNHMVRDMLERLRQEDDGKSACVTQIQDDAITQIQDDAMAGDDEVQDDTETQTVCVFVETEDQFNQTSAAVQGLQGYWE